MKRYAIPLAGLLYLALWACVQTPPPIVPPAPPGPPLVVKSVSCADGSDLLTHVQYVQLDVPVTAKPNTDFSITPDPTPIDAAIQNDLAAAFVANPGFSKNELCPSATGLDGIFINRVGCMNLSNPSDYDPSNCSGMENTDIAANSWGLRTPSNKKYIAISLGLWRCQSGRGYCAPPFTQYHQFLNKALLDKTAGMSASVNPMFKIPPAEPTNTPGLSVLSALAHERGHILWFETFVLTPGDTPSPATLMSEAKAFCGGRIYPGGRWEGVPVGLPNHRYVEFAHLSPNSPVHNLRGLLTSEGAGPVIDGIYRGGRYPSLFAAYSSDEAFVEAFEWSVLRNARVSDVSVNVIGTDRPILTGGHGSPNGAEQKLECFDVLSQLRPR